MKGLLYSIDHAVINFTKPNIFLLPFVLSILLIVISVADIYLQEIVLRNTIDKPPLSAKVNDYPLLKSNIIPEISAKAAIIIDKDSQVVLYAKNPNLRFSPASTTKLMTALTALEYFNLTDILTVKSVEVDGSVLGVSEGARMT